MSKPRDYLSSVVGHGNTQRPLIHGMSEEERARLHAEWIQEQEELLASIAALRLSREERARRQLAAREAEEARRCVECGGLGRCDWSTSEHRYRTRADMERPPLEVSPRWRDPLLATQDTQDTTTTTTRDQTA